MPGSLGTPDTRSLYNSSTGLPRASSTETLAANNINKKQCAEWLVQPWRFDIQKVDKYETILIQFICLQRMRFTWTPNATANHHDHAS
jgi:hypothetical protein